MNSKLQPLTLRIHGMDCAEEVVVPRREQGPLVGSKEHPCRVYVHLLRAAAVSYDTQER